MSPDFSLPDLLTRLRQGDQDAAARIFQAYSGRLVGLARSRLRGLVRHKADPEDVMASVFKSFFRRDAVEAFDLPGWDSLWALLTMITLRKCGYQTRHFLAACRDVQREAAPPEDSAVAWEAIAREPTPAEAAQLTDTVEQLMRDLDERDRPIVLLSLQGYAAPEIADQTGRSERTVYRALDRVRERLEQLRREDADPA